MKPNNIFLVELSGQVEEAKPFDGMSAGVFVDMWGREAEFKAEDLETYVKNTRKLLKSTEGEDGDVVGLPIDQADHFGPGGAAGFIVAVELSDGADKIRFTPRWNQAGRDLIASDLFRFFSPTVDLKNKVILGGSLTNWPATRTATEILLKPVELSSGFYGMKIDPAEPRKEPHAILAYLKRLFSGDPAGSEASGPEPQHQTEEVTMTKEIKTEGGGATTIEALLSSDPARVAELNTLIEARASARVEALLDEQKRKLAIVEFAKAAVGGNADRKRGLPLQQDELIQFAEGLTPDQAAVFQSLVERTLSAGLVDFDELGHSKTLTGRQPLPEPMAALLSQAIEDGLTLEEFFKANAVELGSQADYDLTAFEKAE